MAYLRLVFLLICFTGTYAKLWSVRKDSSFPVGIASVQPQKDPMYLPWTNPEGADCQDLSSFALWESSFFSSVSWNLLFSNWQFHGIPIENTNSWQIILTFEKRNNYPVNATVTLGVRGEDTLVDILSQSQVWNSTVFSNIDSQQMVIPLSDYSDILTTSNIPALVVILSVRMTTDEPTINVSPLSLKIWCLTVEYQYYDCPNACSHNGDCFASPVFGCVCLNTTDPTAGTGDAATVETAENSPIHIQQISPVDCSVVDVQSTPGSDNEVAEGASNATRNILLGALLGGGFFLILLVSLFLFMRSRRRVSSRKYVFQTEKSNNLELGKPQHRYVQSSETIEATNLGSTNSLSPTNLIDYPLVKHLEVKQQLGGGNFGSVYLGEWNGSLVAVKTLNTEDAFQEFEREASILAKLSHPNVVQFLGIYTSTDSQRCLVTEYLPRGSLLDVLNTHKNSLKVIDLLNMCINATSGMCYLESMNIIHRDLAVRNLLVTTDYTVKVGDFGLSRLTTSYQANDTTKIPVKWTAPEVLEGNPHTSRSDVWSLSVVIWEIFSFGKQPYIWLSNKEAVQQIPKGEILPQPPDCPDALYRLMLRCWARNPEERPTFLEILNSLKAIKKDIIAQHSQHKSYNIFVTDEDSPVLGRERTESENSYTKTPNSRPKNKVSFDPEEFEKRKNQFQPTQELRDSVHLQDDDYEIGNNDSNTTSENKEEQHPPDTNQINNGSPQRDLDYHTDTDTYQEHNSKQAPPSFSDYGELHLGAASSSESDGERRSENNHNRQSSAQPSLENDYEETLQRYEPKEDDENNDDDKNDTESGIDVNDSSSSYIYRLKKVKRRDLDSTPSDSGSEEES